MSDPFETLKDKYMRPTPGFLFHPQVSFKNMFSGVFILGVFVDFCNDRSEVEFHLISGHFSCIANPMLGF